MILFNNIVVLAMMCIQMCSGYDWRKIRCSMDRHPVKPGLLPPEEIGRFPWMGVIQHDFYSADTMRYSITGAVLIHPEFALAAAEDMSKIDKDILQNSTYFIVWYSAIVKYTIGVEDYLLHKEYEGLTYATTALVRLVRDGAIVRGDPGPVMQICMPITGSGSFGNIYAIKVSDEPILRSSSDLSHHQEARKTAPHNYRAISGVIMTAVFEYGDFQKQVIQMDIVDVKNCDLYDDKAEPETKMLVPSYPICANAQGVDATCFMESGAVLVSRESDVYWTLLGFGVRGPNCAAPARFIYLMSQMEWIESNMPA